MFFNAKQGMVEERRKSNLFLFADHSVHIHTRSRTMREWVKERMNEGRSDEREEGGKGRGRKGVWGLLSWT